MNLILDRDIVGYFNDPSQSGRARKEMRQRGQRFKLSGTYLSFMVFIYNTTIYVKPGDFQQYRGAEIRV